MNYQDSYCPDTEANRLAQKELRVLSINKIRTIAPGMDFPRNISYPPSPSPFPLFSILRFFRVHPFFLPQRPPVCFIAAGIFYFSSPVPRVFCFLDSRPRCFFLFLFSARSNDLARVFHDLVLIYSGFKRATFSGGKLRRGAGIPTKQQATRHFRWIDTISGTGAGKTRTNEFSLIPF